MANQVWKFEKTGKWLRVKFNGETIADTKRGMLMIESPGEVVYYFPEEDVRMDLLEKSDHTERSGFRGLQEFWHITVGECTAENAAWAYTEEKDRRPDLRGYIAFVWNKMDHWYEEEEEVFYHARNPYHRVDAVPSSRHVKVVIDGETIADSTSPVLVFETGLVTRYYLLPEDVNHDYLTGNDSETICPYKGFASYWDVTVNGNTYGDVVWSYSEPIRQQPDLKGRMAFWTEKDKAIELFVDGEKQ